MSTGRSIHAVPTITRSPREGIEDEPRLRLLRAPRSGQRRAEKRPRGIEGRPFTDGVANGSSRLERVQFLPLGGLGISPLAIRSNCEAWHAFSGRHGEPFNFCNHAIIVACSAMRWSLQPWSVATCCVVTLVPP